MGCASRTRFGQLIPGLLGLGLLLGLASACSRNAAREELAPDPIYHPDAVAAAVADKVALPDPASLLSKPRSVSSFDDRLCFGDQWENTLANHRVSGATFAPQYAGASGRDIGDCAYAIYGFGELGLYHGPSVIKLRWVTGAEQPQDLYVALADTLRERWDWYKVPASGNVTVPSLDKYIGQGSLGAVAVISLDNGSFDLDYILWGDSNGINLNVVTDLSGNPLLNLAPLTVNFDASSSVSYGGTISGFDFDWGDDGIFDVTGIADGKAQHVFGPGSQRVAVRATDSLGQATTTYVSFVSVDPNNADPIASFTMTPNNGNGPLPVTLNADSSSDPDGSIVQYRWDIDGDGVDDLTSTSPQMQYTFAQAGTITVRLTVRDNYFGEATQTKNLSMQHGWHENVVDAAADVRVPAALCTSGAAERANVAYLDTYHHELRFCRANDAQASTWGTIRQPATEEFGLLGPVSMVTSVGSGNPIVCYGDFQNNYGLFTVTAANPGGSSWLSPVLVDASNHTGAGAHLSLVNTIPVIAASSLYTQIDRNDVYYYKAVDLEASAWLAPNLVLAMQDGIEYGPPAIANTGSGIFKKPILLIPRFTQGNYDSTVLVSSTSIEGNSWPSPTVYPWYMNPLSAMLIGNQPTFYGSTAIGPGSMAFFRATNSDGSDWPAQPQAVAPVGGQAVCAIHGGVPEMYYADWGADAIYLCRAKDALGAAWDAPYRISGRLGGSQGQLGVTLVSGEPVLAFGWRGDVGVYELHSASWY